MSPGDRSPGSTGPRPTRIPGESDIELAAMAGDLQLAAPRRPGSPRRTGLRVATDEQRRRVYRPREDVPVSGVYDVVDQDGAYLDYQITCHAGGEFPPSRARRAHRRGRLWTGGPRPVEYGYRLAYEAAHLHPVGEEQAEPPAKIFRPGEPVPVSGIYGVVDEDGAYLEHQRACVKHRHGEDPRARARNVFPPLAASSPDAAGYVLQYAAEHLTDR